MSNRILIGEHSRVLMPYLKAFSTKGSSSSGAICRPSGSPLIVKSMLSLVRQPHLLQLDIVGGEQDLFFQRDQIVPGLRQYITHDTRQLHHGRGRVLRLVAGQRVDIVEGIEKEMRVDLRFQKGQLGL